MQTPPDPKTLAAQLRQPSGELGIEVGRAMNKSNAALYEEALRILALPAGPKTLLEIGPGNGAQVADWLQRYDELTYTGIDYSELMVAQAQELNADAIAANKARFFFEDVHALPLPDAQQEYAFTANTVYFWADPLLALQEIYRVLRPGGVLVMALRSADTMKNLPFTAHGFNPYTLEKLEALYAASAFGPSAIHHFHEDMRTDAAGNTYPADSYIVRAVKALA
jgi:ubiquinone/menaquinone biosynthesis C-methylase UbiE